MAISLLCCQPTSRRNQIPCSGLPVLCSIFLQVLPQFPYQYHSSCRPSCIQMAQKKHSLQPKAGLSMYQVSRILRCWISATKIFVTDFIKRSIIFNLFDKIIDLCQKFGLFLSTPNAYSSLVKSTSITLTACCFVWLSLFLRHFHYRNCHIHIQPPPS